MRKTLSILLAVVVLGIVFFKFKIDAYGAGIYITVEDTQPGFTYHYGDNIGNDSILATTNIEGITVYAFTDYEHHRVSFLRDGSTNPYEGQVSNNLNMRSCEINKGYYVDVVEAVLPGSELYPIVLGDYVIERNDFYVAPGGDPSQNYLEDLEKALDYAIGGNSFDTIYWDEGDALPNYIMKVLYAHPELSLNFKYSYEGKDYEIYIAPGTATNDDIPWYGPLWLAEHYSVENVNAPAEHGTYIVVRGDSLSKIAKKFGTSVSKLMELNPSIKNKNLIYAGMELSW